MFFAVTPSPTFSNPFFPSEIPHYSARTHDRQLVTVTNPVEAAQSEGLYIMSTLEKKTAIGAYLDAIGIPAAAQSYALPYLVGEKPVPTAVESALAETAATVADGITVTLVEAAKRKGLSRSTLFRMTKDGTLPTVCIRGKNRIRLGDLERAFAPSAIKGVSK